MGKKKKKQLSAEKVIDINDCWVYCVDEDEEIGDPNCYHWFDKESYKFYRTRDIAPNGYESVDKSVWDKYIQLFQFNKDMQYKSLAELLNVPSVTRFFEQAKDRDDVIDKYRKFVEYNALYVEERYRLYLTVYPLMIKWCKENGINYEFELMPIQSSPNIDIFNKTNEFFLAYPWQFEIDHSVVYPYPKSYIKKLNKSKNGKRKKR